MSDLVVEFGTGKLNAESYASLEFADYYATIHPSEAWDDADEDDKENALRAATQYLDANYFGRWQGNRYSRTQRLDWPRWGVIVDGYGLDAAPLPVQLQEACCELAQRALTGDLAPDVTEPGTVKSESVKVGPIEETKTYGSEGRSQVAWYRKVEMIIARLLEPWTLERA